MPSESQRPPTHSVDRSSDPGNHRKQRRRTRLVERRRAELGPDRFDRAWRAGQAMTFDQAIDEAVAAADEIEPEELSAPGNTGATSS
jgi:hypothetical protein